MSHVTLHITGRQTIRRALVCQKEAVVTAIRECANSEEPAKNSAGDSADSGEGVTLKTGEGKTSKARGGNIRVRVQTCVCIWTLLCVYTHI